MKKLLIVLAVLCLAAPTMAAEWNFYGNSRFATFSIDKDMDLPNVDSDTDTLWTQQGNSRIGATVKFNDQIGGRFEYGAGSNINKRHLYGTYNFGVGEVLIGQTYTPTSDYFYSNSVINDDGDLLGIRPVLRGPSAHDPVDVRRSEAGLCGAQHGRLQDPGRWYDHRPLW